MRFSIIIVSWNGAELLKQFLPSVAATNFDSFEIILADNASTDDSAAFLKTHFPNVKHALFSKNFGYCGGNNRAVEHASGEWLIFLNNDVLVDENWLQELDTFIKNHPDIGILQPDISSFREPDSFEYAGASGGFLDRYGYPFCRGRVMENIEKNHHQYAKPEFISWASGAALVIRKDIFEELHGFADFFEFHMEEIDLCWRAWRRGYRVAVVPSAKVYHLGGGSLATGSYRKWFYNFRNSLFMLVRNDTGLGWPIRLLFRMVLDGAAAVRGLLTGQPVIFKAVLMAHLAFYRNLPKTLRWRWAFQTHTEKEKMMPRLNGCLPINFFLGKKRTFESLSARINRTFPV